MHNMKELTPTKIKLIDDIDHRVEDKILEPSNAKLLIKLITNADNDAEATAISALGTTYHRTGLVFSPRLDKPSDLIKYFVKNEKLSFHTDDTKPVHKLIIGENFDALSNLLIQYRNMVDVIYIDPPYGKDDMGEYAQTTYDNAISRDNLLSMLQCRLELAKQLLNDNGVIFCSIDDKNQAYLKCLFDLVFGENSYVTTLTIETASIAGPRRVPAMQGSVVKTAEYCLVYTKSDDKKIMKNLKYDYIPGFDTHYKDWVDEVNHKIISFTEFIKADLRISTIFSDYKLNVSLENLGVLSMINSEIRNWLYNENIAKYLYRKGEKEDEIPESENQSLYHLFQIGNKWYVKTDEGLFNVYRYIDRIGQCDDYFNSYGERTVRGNLWKGFSSDGGNLNKEGCVSFKNGKKPLRLIKQLIDCVSDSKNAIVLDFFAGSGTTGNAVLELNKDGGNRTFLLCQINERTEEYPNGIPYDVTTKRLKRIMTGECYNGDKNFSWLKQNKPYGGNLDVYEIKSVSNKKAVEGETAFDVIDETLYGKEKFSSFGEKIKWVCENFANTQNGKENDEEWENRRREI